MAIKSNEVTIGMMLPTHAPKDQPLDFDLVGSTAEWAEKAGFDAIWAGDHIFHAWQFMEALTVLSYVAGRTKTIELGTGVMLMPMRQLSVAASQIATLSILSKGRFNLGMGIGGEWPLEWVAARVPTKERGPRLDEMLPLLRRLFSGETIDFDGRFNTLPGVSLSPKPPHIPFYLAGRAPLALERVGKYADGWIGFFLTPKGFKRDVTLIDEARERAGRLDQPFKRGILLNYHFAKDREAAMNEALALNLGFPKELTLAGSPEQLMNFAVGGTTDHIVERLQDYIDQGCDLITVAPMRKDNAGNQEDMQRFAEEVLPRIKQSAVRKSA